MKNTFLFLFLLTLSSSLFLGCKKYEDGPKFTLRTVKHRLTSGTWRLTELTINGSNVTDSYNEINFSYNFKTDGSLATTTTYTQSFTYSGQLQKVYGTVSFTKDDQIEMTLDEGLYVNYTSGWYPDVFSYDNNTDLAPVWKIRELSNKTFWLEATVDGEPVIMKLEKSN
jgi:hypothetical protein